MFARSFVCLFGWLLFLFVLWCVLVEGDEGAKELQGGACSVFSSLLLFVVVWLCCVLGGERHMRCHFFWTRQLTAS